MTEKIALPTRVPLYFHPCDLRCRFENLIIIIIINNNYYFIEDILKHTPCLVEKNYALLKTQLMIICKQLDKLRPFPPKILFFRRPPRIFSRRNHFSKASGCKILKDYLYSQERVFRRLLRVVGTRTILWAVCLLRCCLSTLPRQANSQKCSLVNTFHGEIFFRVWYFCWPQTFCENFCFMFGTKRDKDKRKLFEIQWFCF